MRQLPLHSLALALVLMTGCTPDGPDASEDTAVEDTGHPHQDDTGDEDTGGEDTGDEDTGDTEPPVDLDPIEGDALFYGQGLAFEDVVQLSDGTVLVAGEADDLSWAPVTPIPLGGGEDILSSDDGYGFLLHLAPDLQTVLNLVHFPEGTVGNIQRIRTTNVPGRATGDLYISGRRDGVPERDDGYYIARLDGNFVDAVPRGARWAYDVGARPRQASGGAGTSAYKDLQPWDVDAAGRVTFGRGAEYDFRWASIHRLDADGELMVVEHWPAHWGDEGEHHHQPASTCPGRVDHSGIVLKAGRRGSLRSHSAADFEATHSDGNGRTDRPGTWPDDVFFRGPCLPEDCPGGRGYTGYKTSDKTTQRLGGIVVDRRNGAMYFGISTQSVLPSGLPDFEPAVVAMDADGRLMWWNRLYEETDANSTPDQYVDGLALDVENDRLVVLARAHGNNVINLWRGHEIHARPEATAFQNQFTGNNGNIHISWLGSFGLDGELHASTYVAEYANGTGRLGRPHPDPNLDGWPDPNGGWPDVNTTRCRDVEVGLDGRVVVTCRGRRTITTANAYQKMLKFEEGHSAWNSFVRVYGPDLRTVPYSSLVVGPWDPETQQGGGNTQLRAVLPVAGGVLFAGLHTADEEGRAQGNPVPTTAVPAWGAERPSGQTPLLGHLVVP